MGDIGKSSNRLTDNVYVISGAINTGILVRNDKALLIDCCDSLSFKDLAEIGVDIVDMILFTQHRRTHTAGAYQFVNKSTEFIVPYRDKQLFENAEAYWENQENRWHLYHNQPGPLVMVKSLPVSGTVREGDVIDWEGFRIEVFETPGATDGSVSYLLKDGDTDICFSGDVIYGHGQIFDLYSLQKGFATSDYHGFIGNMKKLVPSMLKLKSLGADLFVPSHGDIINEPSTSITTAIELLEKLLENYYSVTSINYYFPDYFNGINEKYEKMKPALCYESPDFIRFAEYTSFALVSDTGTAVLIDCGHDKVVDTLQNWILEGGITSVDACWVTHYHDDHVDALGRLTSQFSCPVITTEHVADIIGHPLHFFLPCISPDAVHVEKVIPDGLSWCWNEFTLTAFHFPGQTFYHSGLLVEGHNKKIFFAGDSASPTGIDDYCCGNRNFLGENRGYRRCIDIIRKYKPDYIINQHQPQMFKFTDSHLDYIELKLIEREKILSGILPWGNPNFGTDEWWVRTYPYEQAAMAGSRIYLEVHFTNHDSKPVNALIQPLLPEGWELDNECSKCSIEEIIVPPDTSGSVNCGYMKMKPDGKVTFQIKISENVPEKRYIIPFRITWDGRYLGQFRHAIVLL